MNPIQVTPRPIPAGELRFRQHLASAQVQGGAAADVSLDPSGLALIVDLDDGDSVEIRVEDLVQELLQARSGTIDGGGPAWPIDIRVVGGCGERRVFQLPEDFERAMAEGWLRAGEIDGAEAVDAAGETWVIAPTGWTFCGQPREPAGE